MVTETRHVYPRAANAGELSTALFSGWFMASRPLCTATPEPTIRTSPPKTANPHRTGEPPPVARLHEASPEPPQQPNGRKNPVKRGRSRRHLGACHTTTGTACMTAPSSHWMTASCVLSCMSSNQGRNTAGALDWEGEGASSRPKVTTAHWYRAQQIAKIGGITPSCSLILANEEGAGNRVLAGSKPAAAARRYATFIGPALPARR